MTVAHTSLSMWLQPHSSPLSNSLDPANGPVGRVLGHAVFVGEGTEAEKLACAAQGHPSATWGSQDLDPVGPPGSDRAGGSELQEVGFRARRGVRPPWRLEMCPLGPRQSHSCTFHPKPQPLEWVSASLAFQGVWGILGAHGIRPGPELLHSPCGSRAVGRGPRAPATTWPSQGFCTPDVPSSPGSDHRLPQSEELGCTRPGHLWWCPACQVTRFTLPVLRGETL